MTGNNTKSSSLQSEAQGAQLLDDWFDPIEAGLRDRVLEFIQVMIESRARNSARPPALLAGTNTRRVRRALAAVFGGAISRDTVSRAWGKVKCDWDAWNARPLAESRSSA